MTVKEVLTKVCEDSKTFPKGWNTDVSEVCGTQGNNASTVIWVFRSEDITEFESAETFYYDKSRAKAAMEEEIRQDVAFYKDEGRNLVRHNEDYVELEGRAVWSIRKVEVGEISQKINRPSDDVEMMSEEDFFVAEALEEDL